MSPIPHQKNPLKQKQDRKQFLFSSCKSVSDITLSSSVNVWIFILTLSIYFII